MTKTLLPGPSKGGWLGWNFGMRLRKDILSFVEELARDHADLAYFRTGPIDNVVLTSPALIHEALATRAKEFPKHQRALRLLSRLDGQAITVAQGDPWRRQRRLVQPAFQAGRLGGYADIVVAATREMLGRWRDGPIDLADEMTGLALEVIAQALFGTDVVGRTQALGRAVQDFSEALRWEVGSPLTLPDWLPFPGKRRKRRAVREVHDFIEGAIGRRRAAATGRDDLLGMLLRARDDEGGGGLTDRQVRDEAVALFRGGFDTTAAGLTWTFHLLATHPDAADRARAEADAALGERAIADLPHLPYVSMVVKESLRLYPPIWALFGRRVPAETDLGGYRLPKGAWVHIFPWGQHRSPRLFRDPLRFDPERFSPERGAEIEPHAYLPFGLGPHVCVGKEFALMQMTLTVATVLQRMRLEPPLGGCVVVPEAAIAVRPKGGLRLVVRRRCT